MCATQVSSDDFDEGKENVLELRRWVAKLHCKESDGGNDNHYPNGVTGRVTNPSERKNAPSSVKKCPKWGFYHIRASEKMPDTLKWGIFPCFIAFLLSKENAPCLKKCQFFRKRH